MIDRETSGILQHAMYEITHLRKRIETLEPKAEAYMALLTILRLMPGENQAMSEDIVWRIKHHIDEHEQKEE